MDGFEELLRRIVREEVRAIVREELAAALPAAAQSPRPAPERLYLTPKAAAEIVGVSEKTLCRWIQRGALRGRTIGRLIRIARADLDQFMKGRCGPHASPSVDEAVSAFFARRRK